MTDWLCRINPASIGSWFAFGFVPFLLLLKERMDFKKFFDGKEWGVLFRREDVTWTAFLLFFIVIVWCWVAGRTTLGAWLTPISYSEDTLLALANAKAYMDGDVHLVVLKLVQHLNSPFAANWNDWPIAEEFIYFSLGMLGRVFGIFAAANLLVLSCHLLAGWSFWLVSRLLGVGREYAFSGAIAYAFSHYLFARGLSHLTLSTYWHLPLACLVSWWVWDRQAMGFSSRRWSFSVGVSLIVGALNPYYAWMYIQFVGFALLKRLVCFERRAALEPLFLILATIGVFVLFNLDTFYYQIVNGGNPAAVSRSLAGLEIYGLKLPELFLPPSHRWDWLAGFAQANYYTPTFIKGELGSPYLGIFGISGFVTLVLFGLYCLFRAQSEKIPVEWWQVLWVVLYSLIGGVNLLVGSAGFVLFRGTNRYGIFILTIVLIYFVRFLTKHCAERGARAFALVLVPVILWDQLPMNSGADSMPVVSNAVAADRAFAERLESRTFPGAMVFQLPVMQYPEVPPVLGMKDYEHFRPYLFTKSLRYSYGTNKGRSDAAWQSEVAALPVNEMIARLERYGFAAVYLNKKGYSDGGASLIAAMSSAGRAVVAESEELIAFSLQPASRPVLPMSTSFGSGWSSPEVGHRWAESRKAEIVVLNPSKEELHGTLEVGLRGLQKQTIGVSVNGVVKDNVSLDGNEVTISMVLEFQPGANTILFSSDVTPAPPGNGDPRSLAFDVFGLKISY
ncbi:hypothetical protein [Niveibacterium sp. 24ML]|uniref:hypothetical protein n=1 Tax=Niveibacterium sp. 24ML TaxID=2985512 RepID=UPI00226E6CC3|nr:hypothetical protein [Niveibacterium sp. 24ML]